MIKNKFIISGVLINSNYELLVFSKINGLISGREFILPTVEFSNETSPEESLIKEISYITGLICNPCNLRSLIFVSHKFPGYSLIQLIYLITKWDGVINSNNNLNWISFDQISDYLCNDFYQDFIIKIVPLIKGLRG